MVIGLCPSFLLPNPFLHQPNNASLTANLSFTQIAEICMLSARLLTNWLFRRSTHAAVCSDESFFILAPPTFIQRLPPYTGAMSEAEHFSVQCQVECSPLCNVYWLKDGTLISDDDDRYTITNREVDPDVAKNDFESVESTLRWNIANWPGRRLDRVSDNANYTCKSTGNLIRTEGVSSTTYFRVECKL